MIIEISTVSAKKERLPWENQCCIFSQFQSIFHLKVQDSAGKPIEGAIIELHRHHKKNLQASQLSTDYRGHAFVAFHNSVHDIQFDIHPPKNQRPNQFLRAENPYKLQRRRHRQIVNVDIVKKVFFNIMQIPASFYAELHFSN